MHFDEVPRRAQPQAERVYDADTPDSVDEHIPAIERADLVITGSETASALVETIAASTRGYARLAMSACHDPYEKSYESEVAPQHGSQKASEDGVG